MNPDIKANFIALISAFAFEPIFISLNVYALVNWELYYGVPIYFFFYLLAHRVSMRDHFVRIRNQGWGSHLLIRKLNFDEDLPMDLLLSADPSRTRIEGYTQRGECFVAEEHSSIIGVYVLLATRPGKVELMNIAVIESFHGKGIGKKLVSHAIQTSKARGFKTIEIGTGNSSVGQLALYQKCGFRIVGVDPDFFIRNYSEEIYENGIQCQDMIRLSLNLEI